MKLPGGVAVVLLALSLSACRLLEPPLRPPTARPAGTAHRIPDAFPLLAGWSAEGTVGPSRVLAPLVPPGCRDVEVPPHVDLLRATWQDQERQLVTFATEPEASAYADELRACDGHVERAGRHVLLSTAPPDAEVVTALGMLDNTADRPWFGPEGYGAVRLGTSRSELEALPHTELGRPARCTTFTVQKTDAGLEPAVSGILEHGRGVTSIALAAASSTPEGIGRGASYEQVLLAYPRAEGDRDLLTAGVPGHPDRYYRFELGPEGVASLLLVARDQHCAG